MFGCPRNRGNFSANLVGQLYQRSFPAHVLRVFDLQALALRFGQRRVVCHLKNEARDLIPKQRPQSSSVVSVSSMVS